MGHPANRISNDKISETVNKSFDMLLHHYMSDLKLSRTEAFNKACENTATITERNEKPAHMTWAEFYA